MYSGKILTNKNYLYEQFKLLNVSDNFMSPALTLRNYAFLHTFCVCDFHNIHTIIIRYFLPSINQLALVVEMQCVFCEAGTDS